MKKEKYETAEIEIIRFSADDIITTSSGVGAESEVESEQGE